MTTETRIPVHQMFCTVAELDAVKHERDRLLARVAELEQRPLLAVVECPECARRTQREPTNGRYLCPHCSKTFFSEGVRDSHIARVHPPCAQCGQPVDNLTGMFAVAEGHICARCKRPDEALPQARGI